MQRFMFGLTAAVAVLATHPLITRAQAGEGEVDAGTDAVPLQDWQYLVGFFLPLLIAWLMKNGWSLATQSAVMFGVVTVVSLVTMYLQGQLNDLRADTIVAKILGLMVITVVSYKGVWKPLGVAPAIQTKVASPLPG